MRTIIRTLAVFLCFYAFLAWANSVQEDTIGADDQSASYVVALSVPNPPQEPPRWTFGSCVEWAKHYVGHQGEIWGIAGKMQPTTLKPYVGGLVLTSEGKLGHIAVITRIEKDHILVIEANYIPGQVSTRSLSLDNPLIRGFR